MKVFYLNSEKNHKFSIKVLTVLLTLIYSVIERMKIIKLKTAMMNPE